MEETKAERQVENAADGNHSRNGAKSIRRHLATGQELGTQKLSCPSLDSNWKFTSITDEGMPSACDSPPPIFAIP